MKKYPINITSEITEEKLQKGTFIFIYRATRIPPHIGIITNGLLYDITSVGPNIELPVIDFYKTALKRKTEILFVELNSSELEGTNKIIGEKVKKHWKVTAKTSCLAPVKEFLEEIYNTKNKQRLKQWLATRLLLSEFFEGVNINYDKLGKPHLDNDWFISISHSLS